MFPRNRKDAARGPEAQESYSTLFRTYSTRGRPDGKTYLWSGLTTKSHMICSSKAG